MAHNLLPPLHLAKGFLYILLRLLTLTGRLADCGDFVSAVDRDTPTATYITHTQHMGVPLRTRGHTTRLIARQDFNILTTFIAALCRRFFLLLCGMNTVTHYTTLHLHFDMKDLTVSKEKLALKKKKK